MQPVRSTKVELSVTPENVSEVQSTNVLTSDNHAYLKQLRAKFHNRIQKLDENDTPSDLRDNKENNKRYLSVSITDKNYDKELEPFKHNKKRICTYQVGTSKFEAYAPRHIHVGSVYTHKQFQTKNSEYEEDKIQRGKL